MATVPFFPPRNNVLLTYVAPLLHALKYDGQTKILKNKYFPSGGSSTALFGDASRQNYSPRSDFNVTDAENF